MSKTHPVEAAVSPLKSDAIERAEKNARALIEKIVARLEQHGWDLNKAAPRPTGREDRATYRKMISRHNLFLAVTTWVKSSLRYGEPHLRQRAPEVEDRFVQNARELAAQQYDAFVAKLVGKIGECDSATLTGSHVWGHSVLTVTKGDIVERWQTRQVVNQSKLGTLYNQWPSRKLK